MPHIHYIAKGIHSPILIMCNKVNVMYVRSICTVNKAFQLLPWPQVCKSKNLGMQTVSTNICERMCRSQELSEFQRGTVTVAI